MSYERASFDIQGYTFNLKPTSPRNVKNLFEYLEDSDIDEDDDPLMDLGQQYVDVLFLLADSEAEKSDIDPMDIDIRKVDSYMQDFLPMQSGTETPQNQS
jgi:hypothetical protein